MRRVVLSEHAVYIVQQALPNCLPQSLHGMPRVAQANDLHNQAEELQQWKTSTMASVQQVSQYGRASLLWCVFFTITVRRCFVARHCAPTCTLIRSCACDGAVHVQLIPPTMYVSARFLPMTLVRTCPLNLQLKNANAEKDSEIAVLKAQLQETEVRQHVTVVLLLVMTCMLASLVCCSNE
jgi:hypothetical protein